jgi:N-hydroxyarylamine O-acetyltransferase
MTAPSRLDLDAYLERVGHDGPVGVTEECLQSLHQGHVRRIPFENLEIHLGRGMPLEVDAVEEILVRRRRGGYCFQMNTLFHSVLEAIGFRADRLRARVWTGRAELPPASHQLLRVELDGRPFLADVGFGGGGLSRAIPLSPGTAFEQPAFTFRVVKSPRCPGLMFQKREGEDWLDVFSFELAPAPAVDFLHANYFLSHSPDSFFVQNRVVSLATVHGWTSLFNRTLKVRERGREEERTVADGEELGEVLRDHFGIELREVRDLPEVPRLPPASR